MTLYRRLKGKDCWHFHEGCQHFRRMRDYAEDRVLERDTKPRHPEFCNTCLAKARKDKQAKA